MPPQSNPETVGPINNMQDVGRGGGGMRRVNSESSMSEAGSPDRTARDYRVRKSKLIG
jgi:hypothetical protein